MKAKNIKAIQEFCGVNLPSTHAEFSTPASLFLMRLRSRLAVPQPAKRRLTIPVNFRMGGEIHAQPVKITHL